MNETTQSSWDAYWQYHESPDYINYTPQIINTVQAHLNLQGSHVLEIGAGTGGNSSRLAALGAHVTAFDFSNHALRRITVTAGQMGVDLQIVQGDAYYLPFESGVFDFVFHQGFLEHFLRPEELVREQRRVLRQGGFILIDVPQRFNWYTIYKRCLIRLGRWPYGGWEREFSLNELERLLLAQGFRVIDAYGRGYYPRPLEMLRNLPKMESKLLRRTILPSGIWNRYNAWWSRFEKSRAGCNVLQCIGVLAEVVAT